MSIHKEKHPKSGQTVKISAGDFAGQEYRLEDWWDRIAGKSWMFCAGNPVCLDYAMRSGFSDPPLPTDNEVVYGKIGGLGKLIHVSQIAE